MSNIIEEFILKIKADTKGAKKELTAFDKFLDTVGRAREQKDKQQEQKKYKQKAEVRKKAQKQQMRQETVQAMNDKARHLLAIKEFNERERKRAVTQTGNPLANKSAQSSAAVFEKEFKAKADAEIKANERVSKARLQAIKRESAVKRSVAYQSLEASGRLGSIPKRLKAAAVRGDVEAMKDLNAEIRNLSKHNKRIFSLATAQNGLADSTRNMIRQYASLYAVFAGTGAIKNVGQDFQGMQAAMLAASGGTKAAAEDMKYIDGIVDEMGLNLKDTTDAFVKFKFAAKGKISQDDQESLFTSLSMFGTSLKVGTEDMKRAQKAVIQMVSKGKVMAKNSLAL